MAITPGTRLGPYEVLAQIGAGGMGEVYKATDTNLKRSVAIKVLPASVADDADRLARFQREAEVLAALNHPNIAAIYRLERSGSTTALVMELVEGPTLADRIAQGAIPIDEALPIAKQIAEALEAAHEQGIIHRDLKPANIKVRPDGTVKVLDFGLAKAMEPGAGSSPSASMSPTITSPAMMTGAGMILGTAAYMSPEQARGKVVDRRVDIWAFGAVLFEMLTGQRAFGGEDVAETLANVINKEPAWEALPTAVSAHVRQTLRLCLRKPPRERVPDIGAVRLALEGAFETAAPQMVTSTSSARRLRFGLAGAAIVVLMAAVTVAILATRNRPSDGTSTAPFRASILLSTTSGAPINRLGANVIGVDRVLALSPDGRRIVFAAASPDGTSDTILWLRALDNIGAEPLSGSENGSTPFWSPDGRFVAFFVNGTLKKIPVAGGPPVTVATSIGSGGTGAGGTWNSYGDIVFSDGSTLFRVAATGGAPVKMESPKVGSWPYFVSDGRHFLYRGADFQTYVGSLDGNVERLLGAGGNAQYANGHVLFAQGSTVLAQRVDPATFALFGEPVPVVEGVRTGTGGGNPGMFSASQTGVVVFETGSGNIRLSWFSRSGDSVGVVGTPGLLFTMGLSSDGNKLAYTQLSEARGAGWAHIWVTDLPRNVTSQLTIGDSSDTDPRWSPDMSQLAYTSARVGDRDLKRIASNGGVESVLVKGIGNGGGVDDWSPDSHVVLYHTAAPRELLAVSLNGDGKPTSVIRPRSGRIDQVRFSPDGKWIAYNADESGRFEVYITNFPSTGARWQVSAGGGVQPMWRADGRELYFLAPDGTMMVAGVQFGSSVELTTPRPLFRTKLTPSGSVDQYASSPDGSRFLIMEPLDTEDEPLTVIVNWPSLIK